MTTIYFIRHADVIYDSEIEDHNRVLSPNGWVQAAKVSALMEKTHLDHLISSPYLRSIQTLQELARNLNKEIKIHESLKERRVADGHIADFGDFVAKQWSDFDFKLLGGESLNETKTRAMKALNSILKQYKNQTIAIGTHGTILSTILNNYDINFGYDQWRQMKMPAIYKLVIQGNQCITSTCIDV